MSHKHIFDKTGVLNTIPKFKMILNPKSYRMAHPVYKLSDIETIKHYHHPAEGFKDKLAQAKVGLVRGAFDFFTRYNPDKMNERDWLLRILVLETVAGVPGMVAGAHRHLRSLRTLEHDNGWIHHLLQEAENERMHLFIFMQMRNPGIAIRSTIAIGQAFFLTYFNIAYFLSPKFAHRFVGYIEEEAVHTYTLLIKSLDDGNLKQWEYMKAPSEAIHYYGLDEETATMRDVFLSVRADEAVHRSINHHFSDIPQYYDVHNDNIQVSEDGFKDSDDENNKQIRSPAQMLNDSRMKDMDFNDAELQSITDEPDGYMSTDCTGKSKYNIPKEILKEKDIL